MKIILWVGNEPNQKALANKIHSRFPLSAIILETRINKKKLNIKEIFTKAIEIIFLNKIRRSWKGMAKYYDDKFSEYPKVEILNVENINCKESYNFTKSNNPDLVLVSGTSIVNEELLSLQPSIGVLNLHTGISPYIKGGPNCTNWCIATKNYHLIGNTIMWIDSGIDTGNILTTEFSKLDGHENLFNIHVKVMNHAHDLYVRSIDFISKEKKSNVKQEDISTKGKTFYTKQWNLKEKFALINNLEEFKLEVRLKKINTTRKKECIKTVQI